MDVWVIFNLFLKVLLYICIFGSVGGLLLSLEFRKQLTAEQEAYCDYLTYKSNLIGAVSYTHLRAHET